MAMALTVWVFPSANTLHSSIARASASAIARASSSSPTISLPAASPPDHDIITTGSWQWNHRCFVHYQYSSSAPHDAPAVLLLPGFGVGSFHFEHQLRGLASQYRVWAMDFLGQGRSWPSHDPAPSPNTASPEDVAPLWGFGPDIEPWAKDLAFSVDLWRDQILNFVDQVIGEPVYLVGNSLGGFVGVYFTATYPHLVRGIALLNATPFWAFVPNLAKTPAFARIVPWAGSFPVPALARFITRFGWKQLQDPNNILRLLQLVYVDHSALSDDLITHIVEATEHPAAAAAFCSIIFAPQGEISFNEGLKRCRKSSVPTCLIYGREDPWVVPLWGQRVKQLVPESVYYEISPAGHCPHHEVPEVVNFLVQGWIKSLQSAGSISLPLHGDCEAEDAPPWWTIAYDRHNTFQKVRVRVIKKVPSIWEYLISVFQSISLKIQSRSL